MFRYKGLLVFYNTPYIFPLKKNCAWKWVCHFSKPYAELPKKGDIDQMKFHCLNELISKFSYDLDLQNVAIYPYHMQHCTQTT